MKYPNQCACVIDGGLFAEFAVLLAKEYGKVYFYVPWESNPSSNQMMIGYGLEGVTKVDHWYSILDEVDLWVFPDVYQGPLQEHLVSLGKKVWGSRMGEELELFRSDAKKHFEKLNLSVGKWREITGITKLRDFLKTAENVFVKISRSRGDFETFKSDNYSLIEPFLDGLEHKLGAKKEIMNFVVEDAIEDAVEIGYDGYSVDGRFPNSVMSGIEVKDKGYIGIFKNYFKIPQQMQDVNTKLASTLKEYQYRNFWACELRVDRQGTPWIIDPCCRAGSPPNQLCQLMYTNLAEIITDGANGKIIDPIAADRYGALCLILSDWVLDNWQVVDFPIEIRGNVKLHFPVFLDGRYWVVPHRDGICGAVVATGDTMDSAIFHLKEIASQVHGYGLEIPVHSLDDAVEEFEKLKEFGIDMV